MNWSCSYLVGDGSEDHGVGHQRVSKDEPLGLGEVLHRDSKDQLVVEPAAGGPRLSKHMGPLARVGQKSIISNVTYWLPSYQSMIGVKSLMATVDLGRIRMSFIEPATEEWTFQNIFMEGT